jgi:hypothetical protein
MVLFVHPTKKQFYMNMKTFLLTVPINLSTLAVYLITCVFS